MPSEKKKIAEKYDLICVGGGIMSATLSLMLKLIDPQKKILILERLESVAEESSAAWNNSGTGHSAFCELNYTPEQEDGSIDITKALKVFSQFERSKEFWSYLVKEGLLENPQSFIHSVPHHSWVNRPEDVEFLRKRVDEMRKHAPFREMQYSEDLEDFKKWFPLMIDGRQGSENMAATKMDLGTELNFGELTRACFHILEKEFDTPVKTLHEVRDIDPARTEDWLVEAKNLKNDEKLIYDADHVFIGAGGGALSLLQKVEIEEKEGYGGFPISGQWLVCKNRDVIEKHLAKVYSKAGVDAPPMAAPHLDTRFIDGKRELMFGPFAGFSTKFLKEGSHMDLPKAIKFKNIPAYWGVFWHNIPLTRYLVGQLTMGHEDRMEALRRFIPDARSEDWELRVAGQRVQVIKRDEEQGGSLEFGTDVVTSKDGSITALLGASPGASVVVHIMLEVIKAAYPEQMKSPEWQKKLSEMVPFWNREVTENEEEFQKVQARCSELLGLEAKH